MGLTRAEKHNRSMDKIFDNYRVSQECLPPCHLYGRYLEIAEEKLGITKEEARTKYGQYTVKEWETLLGLGWNK